MYQPGERILLTLWVGGMWAIGYIVAPSLFAMIDDRSLAGTIAGKLFFIINIVGISVALVLLFSQFILFGKKCLSRSNWRFWLLLLMLGIILISQMLIQPIMSELRDSGLVSENARRFAQLHGLSSILFLINSLAGLALVAFGLRRN